MAFIRRDYKDQETVITAENMNDIQDAILELEDGLFSIDEEKSGEVITITDAARRGFRRLSIYGKTTQSGTPTPSAPVDMVSIGNSGSITVSVSGAGEVQHATIATPNGLPGILVTSGGNYTDASGQQWICDEIDLARGVYVQRVLHLSGLTWRIADNNGYPVGNSLMFRSGASEVSGTTIRHRAALCNKLPYNNSALNNEVNGFYFSYGTIYARIAGVSNLDTFASMMNGAEIVTILDNPIETPLSAEEIAACSALRTYKEQTTVSNDAGAWMDLEYAIDAKAYFDVAITSIEQRLEALENKLS